MFCGWRDGTATGGGHAHEPPSIDILAECAAGGQSPVYAAPDNFDALDEANRIFVDLAEPAFQAAAERVGVELVATAEARTIDDINREWEDPQERWAAWQAVHDAVDVDLLGLARQAVAEAERQ